MNKFLSSIFLLSIFFCSCNNHIHSKDANKTDTTSYQGLQGTWVRHDKLGFTLIEIKDTSHVLYYQFADKKALIDTITTDRYWYYRANAKMGYRDNSEIWISTNKFRFDYKIKGDTLIEYDKTGNHGKFIKVYSEK